MKQRINPIFLMNRAAHKIAQRVGPNTYVRSSGGQREIPVVPIEDFSDVSEWALGGTGATIDQDLNFVRIGGASMKFSALQGTGGNRWATKNVNWDMSTALGFWISNYLDNVSTTRITVYLSNDENLGSTTGRWISTVREIWREGWGFVYYGKDAFTVLDGNPDWNLPIKSIRIRIDQLSTQDINTTFDALYLAGNLCSQPKVALVFDDGVESSYTEGFSYASSKGILLSHAIIPSLIGATGYATEAQIDEMYAANNDVIVHEQINLSTVPDDQIEPIITASKDALAGYGWTRGNDVISWPSGEYGQTNGNYSSFYDAASGAGFRYAFSIAGGIFCQYLGVENKWDWGRSPNLNDATTLQEAIDAVDDVIAVGGQQIFYMHGLATVASGNEWAIADWQALIDYLANKVQAGVVQVVTATQL